ncbi:MAG: ATP synthase F0 subunit B [Eubacterium sp.]|nr:ATP synthase F0 subunit B [Eubacterium sp.]
MLHIDINLLFTVINMLVLFGALWLVLFKPVRKILDERQAEANREYDEAKSKQEEAESLKQEYEDNLQKIEQEKSETLANARKKADNEYQRILENANAQAKEITDRAVVEGENEKKKLIKSAEGQIADLVVEAAGKVAGSASGAEFDRSLYDDFLAKQTGE